MKNFIILISVLFCTTVFAHTINWHDGNTITQTTCNAGDNITPPNPIGKYGYTFQGWKEYIPIEYLQNTGIQHINTGVTITNNKRFEIDVQLTSDNPSESSIMGTGGGADSNFVSIRAGNYFGGNEFGFIKNNKYYFPGNITKDTFRHIFVIDLKNNKVKIDQYELITDGTTNSTLTWWIGGYMGSTTTGFDWIGKYYSIKIYDNEILIHHFIPVLDKDGTPCMYDKVKKKYYYNQGKGQFIAGPVISEL